MGFGILGCRENRENTYLHIYIFIIIFVMFCGNNKNKSM